MRPGTTLPIIRTGVSDSSRKLDSAWPALERRVQPTAFVAKRRELAGFARGFSRVCGGNASASGHTPQLRRAGRGAFMERDGQTAVDYDGESQALELDDDPVHANERRRRTRTRTR